MFTVALCEDEITMLDELCEKAGRFFNQRNLPFRLYQFTSGEQLLLSQHDFDIALLDIRLPGMSGMDAAKKLYARSGKCTIIFVTSSREDVFDAFEVDAVNFLVKPVEDDPLFRSLEKALSRIERNTGFLVLDKGQSVRKTAFADIVYCEAMGHRVSLFLASGEQTVSYSRLSDLLEQLDEQFYQCHRSYVVNLAHVVSLESGTARMSTGDAVLVSRRRGGEFAQRLLTYLRQEMIK